MTEAKLEAADDLPAVHEVYPTPVFEDMRVRGVLVDKRDDAVKFAEWKLDEPQR